MIKKISRWWNGTSDKKLSRLIQKAGLDKKNEAVITKMLIRFRDKQEKEKSS